MKDFLIAHTTLAETIRMIHQPGVFPSIIAPYGSLNQASAATCLPFLDIKMCLLNLGSILKVFTLCNTAMVKPESEQNLELRDNLAEFLQIALAEEQAGTLETFPAETVATELGLNWQSVSYHVRFGGLAKQIIARRENAPIAQTILDRLVELAANFDSAEPEPLGDQSLHAYVLRIGERRMIYSANRQERWIVVYLIGRHRELRKRQLAA